MAIKIHYDDNIFYLSMLVQALRNGLTLDIDPEFFKEKAVEDIFFIDSSLTRIFSALRTNTYLIRRTEYLKNLLRANRAFVGFLDDIIQQKIPFSKHLTNFFEKFKESKLDHERDTREILSILRIPDPENPAQEDIVSREEFEFLLKENNPAEEE